MCSKKAISIKNREVRKWKFAEIPKSKEAEGKEKHVLTIEVGKGKGESGADIVHVVVGKETPHPNTVEHHIAWIELYGVKKDGQVIDLGRSAFAPSYTSPNIRFQVPVEQSNLSAPFLTATYTVYGKTA